MKTYTLEHRVNKFATNLRGPFWGHIRRYYQLPPLAIPDQCFKMVEHVVQTNTQPNCIPGTVRLRLVNTNLAVSLRLFQHPMVERVESAPHFSRTRRLSSPDFHPLAVLYFFQQFLRQLQQYRNNETSAGAISTKISTPGKKAYIVDPVLRFLPAVANLIAPVFVFSPPRFVASSVVLVSL